MGHDYLDSDDYKQVFDPYYYDEVFKKEIFVQDKSEENKPKIKNPEELQHAK